LYQKSAGGAQEEELLVKSPDDDLPSSWSADGRFLLYTAENIHTGTDLWVLPLDASGAKAGEPKPFLRTDFNEQFAHLSQDSRWVAYISDESGRAEIYVRAFTPTPSGGPAESGKWLVSQGARSAPVWTNGGRELMYIDSGSKRNHCRSYRSSPLSGWAAESSFPVARRV